MITIIPAIDIIDGKCVRLTQGDYSTSKIYSQHPLDVARKFEDSGCKRLHMVDLDGAKGSKIHNIKVLESVASNTSLAIDFGGGIKSQDDLNDVFNAGAQYATIGSLAVNDTELVHEWIHQYGPEKFIVGIDILDGKIKTRGWLETSEVKTEQVISFYAEKKVMNYMVTDIAKDGKLQGINMDLYMELKTRFPEEYIIASGGIASLKDIDLLNSLKIDGVVIGKALYENFIDLKDIKKYL